LSALIKSVFSFGHCCLSAGAWMAYMKSSVSSWSAENHRCLRNARRYSALRRQGRPRLYAKMSTRKLEVMPAGIHFYCLPELSLNAHHCLSLIALHIQTYPLKKIRTPKISFMLTCWYCYRGKGGILYKCCANLAEYT
jgi:hypothetical protein